MAFGNLLIRASAGTGKTYKLAMRFIELMKKGKVAPESIIAVTFSRAAAQEIYLKIINLLVELAENDLHSASRDNCHYRQFYHAHR